MNPISGSSIASLIVFYSPPCLKAATVLPESAILTQAGRDRNGGGPRYFPPSGLTLSLQRETKYPPPSSSSALLPVFLLSARLLRPCLSPSVIGPRRPRWALPINERASPYDRSRHTGFEPSHCHLRLITLLTELPLYGRPPLPRTSRPEAAARTLPSVVAVRALRPPVRDAARQARLEPDPGPALVYGHLFHAPSPRATRAHDNETPRSAARRNRTARKSVRSI